MAMDGKLLASFPPLFVEDRRKKGNNRRLSASYKVECKQGELKRDGWEGWKEGMEGRDERW
jgi:hypothetical protein